VGKRLGYAVLSVDPIESAMLSAGIDSNQPTGLAAYLVAEAIADAALANGQSIIVDAVNAVNPAREQWVALSKKYREPLRFIEVICSDSQLHRQRLENRNRGLPNFPEPTWLAVEQSLADYAPWSGDSASFPRITLDTVESTGSIVEKALAFVQG
jgi:predicted kinase